MTNFIERPNAKVTAKIVETKAPKIYITSQAMNKMFVFVKECADEIGWLGTVQECKNNEFVIDDVLLFDQEVHGATTEISPEGLAEFGNEILVQPNGVDVWNSIKMWGHSHVNMGITPSGQDDKQMLEFGEIGHDYFIRLIANKKGEMKLDFYNYKLAVSFHDVPWEVLESNEVQGIQDAIWELEEQLDTLRLAELNAIAPEVKAEMAVKVRKFRTVTQTTPSYTKVINQYGRHINGKWVHWQAGEYDAYIASGIDPLAEEEVKKNVTTTSTTNQDTGIINYDNLEWEDYFVRDDEVVTELGISTLMDLAMSCWTAKEYAEELDLYGYEGVFTEEDIKRIMRVARRYQR